MNRSIIDLWVGFFVALGIAAVLFLALKVGNLSSGHLSETYVLQAKFDDDASIACTTGGEKVGHRLGDMTAIGHHLVDARAGDQTTLRPGMPRADSFVI